MYLNITTFILGLYNYPFGCSIKDNEKVLYSSQKAMCNSGKDLEVHRISVFWWTV
jgi:hypothetical protein